MPAATDFGFLENIRIHREGIPYARCSAPFDILLCDDLRRGWDFLYIVFRTRRGDDDFIKGVDGQLFGLCRYPPHDKNGDGCQQRFSLCGFGVVHRISSFPDNKKIDRRGPFRFPFRKGHLTLVVYHIFLKIQRTVNLLFVLF